MNFFEHQHQAKRNTKVLVVLFALAVVAIIFAVTALITFVFIGIEPGRATFSETLYAFMPKIAPLVVVVIGLVSYSRMLSLSGNGDKVALFLGGIPLPDNSTDPKDRVLRNVVEEMSIASGVPVPEIYVMRDELGINAFAAGTDPSRAVIGVTQGALDQLSRDELQGVIAHEYSHIFNGDMRLNVDLIGILAGITFLTTAGRVLLNSRSRRRVRSSKNDGQGAVVMLGVGLFIIGLIGTFFARWIKAAVSRQREFLADASAVQFTRNPDGLKGALMRIREASSTVSAGGAEEASHLFFGSIKSFAIFNTHPPLDERLARLGALSFEQPKRPRTSNEALERVGRPKNEDFVRAITIIQGLSSDVRGAIHLPRTAMEAVLALLARFSGHAKTLQKVDPKIARMAESVPPENALSVVELAMPALRHLEPTHSAKFLQAVEVMVCEDGKLHPFELAVLAILRRQLSAQSRGSGKFQLKDLKTEAVAALKTLARAGGEAQAQAAFAAGAAKIGLKPDEWGQPELDAAATTRALMRLGQLNPLEKSRFFEALWITAHADQRVELSESQILRAFSEALEIPLPATVA